MAVAEGRFPSEREDDMKITYFGTAAYEGVPSLYCECDVCKKSFERGGRNLRSRSQALVNDDLLIDFNADTVCHFLKYRPDLHKIGDCLITHSHCDHLYVDDIEMLSSPYSHEHRALRFYAAANGYERLKALSDKRHMDKVIPLTLVEPGKIFTAAEGKYRILPLRANHDPSVSPVFYAIESGGKRMLYAHDTGMFFDEVYGQLAEFGRLDLISLDCTGCLGDEFGWRDGHMSLRTNLEVLALLKEKGIADQKTIVVLNHFSHNGGQTYEEMLPEAEKHGLIVAYDGLEVEF